ncbi:MAG: hypothetical protein KAI25_07860, partial [Hyphomicrobiaceae bacterium]|nr:hypothetical protein [Hyphomicrobiaceae bacterium]
MFFHRCSMTKLANCVATVVLTALVVVPHAVVASELSFMVSPLAGDVEVRKAGQTSVVTVDGDGYYQLQDTGRPVLPYRIVRVLLLPGETVDNYTFTWTSETVLEADFIPTAAPPHISDEGIETENDPVAEWLPELGRFPSTAGRYLGTGHLHGYSIASFAVFPLIVEQNTLIFLEDLTLELNTKTAENGQEVAKRIRFREGFHGNVQSQLASMVLNPGQTVGYHVGQTRVVKKSGGFQPTSFPSLEGSPVDYVIITNDSLMAAYQALADWKTTKGVPTAIRSTEWVEANYRNGSDLQETIRNFIKDAYAKWGITYVLLGGDTEQVPVRLAHSCFYGGGRDLPVDLYYACLDGDW